VIVYQLKGDIFYAQGQLEEALESFQNSLNLNPDASYAIHPYYQKGLILAKLGRYQEALDTCEFALRLYPKQGEIYELRLEILASFNQDR
jgi:tetratricopeptide (TPR) repeat protein